MSEVSGARMQTGPDWHSLQADEVVDLLAADKAGLETEEAEVRLRRHGPNLLPARRGRGMLRRLADQFHNLLIYVLLAAAILSALMDHMIDAAVILAVVILNAVIGFVQEGRAEQALQAIRGLMDAQASVLRGGRRVSVSAEEVVPGDIVLVEAGDRVPADIRLIRARNLRVDESVLTGESVAVDKDPAPVAAEAELGDRRSMAFSGTFVSTGQGAGIAVATGSATELGRISGMLGDITILQTPLLRQVQQLARRLTAIILAVCAAAFAFAGLLRGYSADEGFMVVVGLAVSAIPEGLPAIMTITLAIGVQRMASRNAIVRRLPAVETLGSVSVICTDKTGTLTRSEMTARTLLTPAGQQEVTGVGYAPYGTLEDAKGSRELIVAGLLCNDADLRREGDQWLVQGDAMEGALVTLAMKSGLSPEAVRSQMPRKDEIPFDADYRFMATLHAADQPVVFIKGAPEQVLDMCSHERSAAGDRPLDKARWHEQAERLAARGERILAFAVKSAPADLERLSFEEVQRDAVLLGLIGFIDPPREEAVQAVADCRAAGIRVIMITGDHAATPAEIARQIGLAGRPRVLTGRDLDRLDDEGFRQAMREAAVFARTTPEHKLRLVEALQADGLTVAMTGDGVNDAPALKRADVGIAMGQRGTEVAKEAAEMVLADDNFASIAAAVREGRTVYDNLRKMIAWTLPTNGGESFTILLALALGLTLPVTPVQILWINMVTAVALGLTLAFEPTEAGVMRRPPRPARESLLGGRTLWRVGFVSMLMVAGAFGTYGWALSRGLGIDTARTMVVNAIVAMEIFYLFSVRFQHGASLTPRGIMGTKAVIVGVSVVTAAQFLFTYWPPLAAVFGARPVPLADGLLVVGVGVLLFVVVELEKLVAARLGRVNGASPATMRRPDH